MDFGQPQLGQAGGEQWGTLRDCAPDQRSCLVGSSRAGIVWPFVTKYAGVVSWCRLQSQPKPMLKYCAPAPVVTPIASYRRQCLTERAMTCHHAVSSPAGRHPHDPALPLSSLLL
jgi:hypothetical protein